MATTSSNENRRRLVGKFVRPGQQLLFSLLLPSLGLVGPVLFAWSGVVIFDQMAQSLSSLDGPDLERVASASRLIHSAFWLMFFSSIIIAGAIAVLGIHWSHRIFGPAVSFVRQINALNSGDYTARIKLRKYDEFRDIETSLNELAATLEKAHS